MQDLREAVAHVGRVDAVEQGDGRDDECAHAQGNAEGQPHRVVGNRGGSKRPVDAPAGRGVEQHREGTEGRGDEQRRRFEEEAARRHTRQGDEGHLEGQSDPRADGVDGDEQRRGRHQEGEHAGNGIRAGQEAAPGRATRGGRARSCGTGGRRTGRHLARRRIARRRLGTHRVAVRRRVGAVARFRPTTRAGRATQVGLVKWGGERGLSATARLSPASTPERPQVDDALAHRGHERGVVRDRHQGDAAREGGAQEAHAAQPRAAVLPEGRLVEDQQLGGADERGRHRQAALLAAREGHGVSAREFGEAQGLEVFVDEGGDLLVGHAGGARADRELLGDGGSQELVFGLLEDHGHATQELLAGPLVRVAGRAVGGLNLDGALQGRQEARERQRKG